MKKKFLAVIIVWMFLFAGCSEGHRRHRGYSVVIRSSRPRYGKVYPPVHYREPRVVISRHPSHTIKKGSYGSRRGPYSPMKGKSHSIGRGKGK